MRKLKTVTLAAVCMALADSATAGLIQYQVQNPQDDIEAVSPETRYVALQGEIQFDVAGGVERRVLVQIIDSSSNVVAEEFTDTIGADDTLTVDGRTYYGKRVRLSVPSAEGRYIVKIALTDKAGASLATEQHRVYFDTEAPYETVSLANAEWENAYAGLTEFDGFVSIDGGDRQPLSYSPTSFSADDYNYKNSSATGLLQLSNKSWIKLSYKSGKLFYINVIDKENDTLGGSYTMNMDGLPDGAEVVVSDDPGEVDLSTTPTADWSWAARRTDGGVISMPFDESRKLSFSATYANADRVDELVLLNNNGTPLRMSPANARLDFEMGGDLENIQIDAWRYYQPPGSPPYYEVDLLGQNVENVRNWRIEQADMSFLKDGQVVASGAPLSMKKSGRSYQLRFQPRQILGQHGEFVVRVSATDNSGNTRTSDLETRVFDTTAPTVSITKDDRPFTSGRISSLDELAIHVEDEDDDEPTLVDIHLTSKNADIYLTARQVDDVYRLEYPVMFPSTGDDDQYHLSITAADAQNNTASTSINFVFEPPTVNLANDDDTIEIPAIDREFLRANGTHLVTTEPLELSDGAILDGSYSVMVTLRSDSELSLVINGTTVAPGETQRVLTRHDFAASAGRLSLPMHPAESGVVGSAEILVSTSAPNAPVLAATIRTWDASVELDAAAWSVRQIIDPIAINVSLASGAACRLSGSESTAINSDSLFDPVCYLEWEELPDGLQSSMANRTADDASTMSVRGRADDAGKQSIQYSLWIYDYGGTPYLLDRGTHDLTVRKASGAIAFEMSPLDEVYQSVQALNLTMDQVEGPACVPTTDERIAKERAKSNRLACLLAWETLPEGISQPSYRDKPNLRGMLAKAGENTIGWHIYAFNTRGEKIEINQQSSQILATQPPTPTVSLSDSDQKLGDGLFVTPREGGLLVDASAEAYNASVTISLSRDGEVYDQSIYAGGAGDTNKNLVRRRIRSDERQLWSQTHYEVETAYTELPNLMSARDFDVIAVPSQSVVPMIRVATDHEEEGSENSKVLNTDPITLIASVDNPYDKGGYDPETMGDWEIRLVQISGKENTPLTEYTPLPADGQKAYTLDLAELGLESQRVKISTQARLLSPIEGYEQTRLATRPAYLDVIEGKPLAATIESRRLTGEAPLNVSFNLVLENRDNRGAIGDIQWQSSTDGTSWTPIENETRYQRRLSRVFDRGTHRIRARITNANSGATSTTAEVIVRAFKRPTLTLEGPENAFIGQTVSYKASALEPDGKIVYQWSTDDGETWTPGNQSFDLTAPAGVESDSRVMVRVRARYKTAPADEPTSWVDKRGLISFREPRAPRVQVTGETRAEVGKTQEYAYSIRRPYRNMNIEIAGQWTLPQGETVVSDTVEYTPSLEQLAAGNSVELTYTAWVVGYQSETTTSDTIRLGLWQYNWPTFYLRVRNTADVAPATVTAQFRAAGTARIRDLDEPKIEWNIPAGMRIVDDRSSQIRKFEVEQAGEYPVSVTITDARGHSSTLAQTMHFDPIPPYNFDFRYSASNQHDRVPMSIRVMPMVSGGHPNDRIRSYRYTLDGVPVETRGIYGVMDITQPGEHKIAVSVDTEMGANPSDTLTILAKENQPPACQIDTRKGATYWRFYARCNDPDGRMASYDWTLNGEPLGVRSYRITVRPNEGDSAPPIVSVVGTDDAGAQSEVVTTTGG